MKRYFCAALLIFALAASFQWSQTGAPTGGVFFHNRWTRFLGPPQPSNNCYLPTPCNALAAPAAGAAPLSDVVTIPPPAYGVPFKDPDTNEYMELCTDVSHPIGSAPTNSGFAVPSFSGENVASYDNSYIAVGNDMDSGARVYFLHLNADALATGGNACLGGGGPGLFTPYVAADWSTQHGYLGVEASGTDAPFAIYSCPDASTFCTTGNVTLVTDLKTTMTSVFGLTAPSITTNGEVTASANGNRVGYWFNGAQDSAIDFAVFDRTTSCTVLVDLSTGNEYATSQCGLPLNMTTYSERTGAITGSFLTGGANKGIHRATLDADGDAVVIANQNNTSGYEIYALPSGGAWATTPMTQTLSASPQLMANHYCTVLGDYIINGAGNNGFGANQNWAARGRNLFTPATFTDFLSTINPGGPIIGWASHQNCAAVNQALTMPFFMATYIYGPAAGPLTEPFMREVDSIYPSGTSQAVYRFGDPHWQYAAGGVSTTNGVVGNGTTVTVTSYSNSTIKNGSATVKIYGCANSAANASPVTATVVSDTQFTYPSSWTGTTSCKFVDTSASNTNVWGASFIQGLRNGHAWISNTSYGGALAPDTHDNGNCAGSGMNCPGQQIIVGSTY